MRKRKYMQSFFIMLLMALMTIFSTVCFSAESTEDVSVDAAMKESLRRQIVGKSTVQQLADEYVVGYRDILYVSVYGEGSMSASEGIQGQQGTADGALGGDFLRGRGTGIEVRIDGRISLSHIGDVAVVGMTLTQIADYLKLLYKNIYGDPSLTVTLVQSNSRQYTVMGQVVTPGLYHLDFPLTIVGAVARAGGFTEWANSEVTVIRQGDKGISKSETAPEKPIFTFDYDDFLKGKDLQDNIAIIAGDVIVVH